MVYQYPILYLYPISNLLSSNENFEIDDTLQLNVTHITMPPPGSGSLKGKRKRRCFGSDNYGELLRSKRSVVRITNDDELCCAKAIVVAKAIADEDGRLKVIKDSCSHLQENLARAPHEEARVPIGPCGLDQIKLYNYRLELLFLYIRNNPRRISIHGHICRTRHAIVHKGPQSNKQIKLLMHDGHFDVISKLPGFFNSCYFCLQCEKAYSTEDYRHHTCHKTKCHACLQPNCADYETFKHTEKAELPCKDCGRHFYGVTCQLNHLTHKANGQTVADDEKNVCKSHKKCSICLHVFTSSVQEHMKHRGQQKCPSCTKEVKNKSL